MTTLIILGACYGAVLAAGGYLLLILIDDLGDRR